MTVITSHGETTASEGSGVEQTNSDSGSVGDERRVHGAQDGAAGEGLEYEAPAASKRSFKGQWSTMVRDLFVGLAALVVGVLGLVLPVLPGWILIFVGLALIAGYVPPLRRALSRLLRTNSAMRSLGTVARRPAARKSFARLMAMRPVRNALDSETRWRTLHSVLKARAGEPATDDAGTQSDRNGSQE
ncbi:MAG: hypothetical protein HKN07_01935 [Acidimicrobiia bacterium]|nr:hypothetical protein [Acidimicrobiia bacterium]